MEKEEGRRGKGPSSKVLNSCLACPISFPASRMGEEASRNRKEQRGGGSSNSLRLHPVARGPFASGNEGCREVGREVVKGCWV